MPGQADGDRRVSDACRFAVRRCGGCLAGVVFAAKRQGIRGENDSFGRYASPPRRSHPAKGYPAGWRASNRRGHKENKMDAATRAVLNEAEKLLIAETTGRRSRRLTKRGPQASDPDEAGPQQVREPVPTGRERQGGRARRSRRRAARERACRRKPRRSNDPFPRSPGGSRSWPGSRGGAAPSGWRWSGPRAIESGVAHATDEAHRWGPPQPGLVG